MEPSQEHGRVSPASPEITSDDGRFSNLEVSPEQQAREFAAVRSGGLEPAPRQDGLEVAYDKSEKQVAVDDHKEHAVGLGENLGPDQKDTSRKKTICGLPLWGLCILLGVVAIVAVAVGVGAGVGISNHNKDVKNA